jgi:diacylglycerol kinase (ATP)
MARNKEKTIFIVNPVSANGRTSRSWRRLEKDLQEKGYAFDVAYTQRPMHAIDITRNALEKGFERVIAVGGDGTFNEVINGFYLDGEKISKSAALSVLPMGTGGDFSRYLNNKSDINYIYHLLEQDHNDACDIVRARFTGWDGKPTERYYLNIFDTGIGSATCYYINQKSKALGGFLSFLSATLRSLATYKNQYLTVKVDGTEVFQGKSAVTAVANGKYFGGGVMIAPHAKIDDGLLDIVIIEDLSKLEFLKNLPKAYKGEHLTHPQVQYFQGEIVSIQSEEKLLLELDGESPGYGDIELKICQQDMILAV